jgi:hypothetical protein
MLKLFHIFELPMVCNCMMLMDIEYHNLVQIVVCMEYFEQNVVHMYLLIFDNNHMDLQLVELELVVVLELELVLVVQLEQHIFFYKQRFRQLYILLLRKFRVFHIF